jgi:hypothetical protein
MAEKHKSKYKKPENKKPTYRKDLKDYTLDDKDGKMNPKSSGELEKNVLRKTDKEVIDNGKLTPDYKDNDRLYKDLEDGEYDPKTALKRMKKRQETEEKDVEDTLAGKIKTLTNEQKERLVREYIRRKIAKVLQEQATPEEDPLADLNADPNAPVDPNAPIDPNAPVDPGMEDPLAMSGGAAAPPPPSMDTTTPPADTTATPAAAPVVPETDITQPDLDKLNKGGNVTKLKELSKIFKNLNTDVDPADTRTFYRMLIKLAEKRMSQISSTPSDSE